MKKRLKKNMEGNYVCGLMDKEGSVTPFKEYTFLYPLANGHLIAVLDNDRHSLLKCQMAE